MIPAFASQPSELPAARMLAAVERMRGAHLVSLPPRFARAAVERLIAMHHAHGQVLESSGDGVALAEGEWAIRVRPGGVPLNLVGRSLAQGLERVYFFARHTVMLAPSTAARLLRALEEVKPEEVDAKGRPLAWAPAQPPIETLAARAADEHDAELVEHASELPAEPDAPPDAGSAAADPIEGWLAALAKTAGIAPPPLVIARAAGRDRAGGDKVDRRGFTTGRIWMDRAFTPLRVRIAPCPNADAAEIQATLAHELAHSLGRTGAHDLAFKRALISLVEEHWGARWFEGARASIDRSYRIVDAWIACGIRAALRGGDVPVARGDGNDDDQQLARVILKIKKLRDLAADQCGRPEGIAASATANDLVTTYGLEGAAVYLDGELHDQLVDMFVPLEEGAVWRRTLAHAVAAYCEVFSLAMHAKTRMHFFGRHADVVAAEYLYAVSAGRITRECDIHLAKWKRARGGSTSGESRRERTSFCDSAAIAFKKKLEALAEESGDSVEASGQPGSARPSGRVAIDRAEDFARAEHAKRGQSWGTGGRRRYRDNAAGRALGGAMEVVQGIGGASARPKALPHR